MSSDCCVIRDNLAFSFIIKSFIFDSLIFFLNNVLDNFARLQIPNVFSVVLDASIAREFS